MGGGGRSRLLDGLPVRCAVLAILISAAASCEAGPKGDALDELTAADLQAVMTAVTDSLGALAIDHSPPGSGVRQEGDRLLDAVPPWFPERVRIAADSMGLPSWSMAEGGQCAMASGLALPPEAPPGGDPETQAACTERPDGVFTLAAPRLLEGERCPEPAICWEISMTAWLLRTRTGLGDNSFVEFSAEVRRSSPGISPAVRLEVGSWFMS